VAEAEPAAAEEAAGEEGEGEGEAGGEAAAEAEAAAEEEAPPKPFEPVEIHPDMATMLLEQWQGCEAEFVANMQRLLRSVRNDHRTAVNWVAEARNRCLSVYVSVCLSACLSVWMLQLVNWVAEARNRCLSVYVSVCLSVCLSVWMLQLVNWGRQSPQSVSVCLCVCLPVCLSICVGVTISTRSRLLQLFRLALLSLAAPLHVHPSTSCSAPRAMRTAMRCSGAEQVFNRY